MLETCTYDDTKVVKTTDPTTKKTTSKTVTYKKKISTHDVPGIIQEAGHMLYWISFFRFFLWGMIYSQIFEVFMIFMHDSDVLGESKYNKIMLLRKIWGIICICVCFFCTWGIYNWDGHKMVNALASSSCTNDKALQDTFVSMKTFLHDAQEFSRKVLFLIFTSLILFFTLAAFAYKKFKIDPQCNHDHKEPLLKKGEEIKELPKDKESQEMLLAVLNNMQKEAKDNVGKKGKGKKK